MTKTEKIKQNKMNGVSIEKVSHIIPLYKKETLANAIEVVRLEGMGFDIVAQKGRFSVGDKAVYIMPDYSISDTPLFESFIRPNGNPKKSRLGKNYRVRASKFNLHTGDGDPTYSNGILFKYSEVTEYLGKSNLETLDLDEKLGVTKYVEPPKTDKNGNIITSSGMQFPSGIYKTDETNYKAKYSAVNDVLPGKLTGSVKVDGSSITFGLKNGEYFIASRKLVKSMTIRKCVSHKPYTIWQKLGKLFNMKFDNRVFKTVDNDDVFIKMASPYVDIMKRYGMDNILFRGELNGGGHKGSGNVNNPARKETSNIKIYGADELVNGVAKRLPWDKVLLLIEQLNDFSATDFSATLFKPVDFVFYDKFFETKEELEKECKNYFKENLIEGIVIRNNEGTFSAKYMNDVYDSKK